MPSKTLWKFIETRGGVAVVCLLLVLFLAILSVLLPGESPRGYPEQPDRLTESSVVEYASDCERAEVYRTHDPSEEVDFHVDCPGALDRTTDRGYYVTVQCSGAFTAPDGRSGHFGEPWSFYLINETATIRIPIEDVERNNTPGEWTGAFYVVNFDDRKHAIRIWIRPIDGTTDSSNDEQSFVVDERSGGVNSELARPGGTR